MIHRTRASWSNTRSLSALTSFTLVVTLVHAPAASAALALDPPNAPRERSVAVTSAGTAPLAGDPAEKAALTKPDNVFWPMPGSAVVDLSAARAKAGASSAASGTAVRERAGTLPVYIGAPATAMATADAAFAEAPSQVKVDLLGRRGDALLLRLARADAVAKAGNVSLEVDYSSFRSQYGGDWATRLHLIDLGTCAAEKFTSGECAGTSVGTFNNGNGHLRGDVKVSGEAGLFAVSALAAGTSGDFGASSLSPSSTWQAGGPSGDFSWNYPIAVPPSLSGPMPELAIAYSSGNVDGRTTGTNNQPSWVGEGMEFTPGGFVERRYAPCASDMTGGNQGTRKTGDLCWSTDNLSYSINGRGGELVRDDATGTWHPRSDDGSKVERKLNTSLGNGDNNGEYWVITLRDGTKLHFGLHKLPGWSLTTHPVTNSVWTVPVYGNHTGEECNKSTFDLSVCQQGYRWNLDYAVDTSGNTMSLFYGQETNSYARNLTPTKPSPYTRGGYLKSIQYGQRDGQVYTTPWVGQVVFDVKDRCIVAGTTCVSTNPTNWPDVPWDQSCTSTTNCGTKHTPSFWTQKRLDSITTQVWGGTAARNVARWRLNQTYVNPQDGTTARLWLASLQQTGLVGGEQSLPAINFDGVQRNNRVDGADHIPPMNWWRMRSIRDESGNEIRVEYSAAECVYGTNLPAPATNGKRCHPVRWTPAGLSELTDWFNKYVVLEVSESDRVNGLEPELTKVEYVGEPAWRHDEEDGLVPEARKTWSQWRGYEKVKVLKGRPTEVRSRTDVTYFRGMDGDKTATANVLKDVKITDSTGVVWKDTDQFAGAVRESITYTADGGTVLARTITDPWLSPATATRVRPWGTTKAYQVQENKVAQGDTIAGIWRQTATTHTYSTDGTMTEQAELGDLSTTADDRCTTITYARSETAWILDLPATKRTVAKPCGQAPAGPQEIVSDERFYYDDTTTVGAAPSKGNLTRREEISGWSNGAATYMTTMQSTYDVHGRLKEQTDVSGVRQKFDYTPATGPTTSVTNTNPLNQTSTTVLEPAFGAELSVTAPDGSSTQSQLDPLGRVVKAWLPGRQKSQSASAEYQYIVRNDGPNVIVSKTLESNGGYRTEYKLLDGKMRVRQTQSPSPRGGRVISDTVYDARGRVTKENGPYWNDAPPGTDFVLPDEATLPAQTVTTFDAANRPTEVTFKVNGVTKSTTLHAYEVDREHITPPLGDTPSTRILDVHGRLQELRQYTGTIPTGTYNSTFYSYTKRGQLESVIDSAGNAWRFFYDDRGRRIRTEDPDHGATSYTFGDGNEVLTETDARGVKLVYEYDAIGRKTGLRRDSATGTKLAEWTYDRLVNGTAAPGLAASSTRFVNGNAYTTNILEYDAAKQALRQEIVIPTSEGALAGRYEFTNTYKEDGEVNTTKLPAVGGLPEETLRYGYNEQGMPITLSGLTSYVTSTTFTEYGEQERVVLSTGGKWLARDFQYEVGTRWLSKAEAKRETTAQLISSVSYSYDQVGNVTRMSDTPDPALAQGVDTQCLRHDNLRRLTEAWTPSSGDCAAAPSAAALGGPAPYWHKWTIDKLGNRTSETKTASGGATTTSNYTYAAGAQPHGVRTVTTGSKVDTYGYDATGNLTTRMGQTLEWDAENNLAKVTEGQKWKSYVYDASGNRLISREAGGATLFLGNTQLRADANGNVVGTRYYELDGRTVAMRSSGRVTWLVSDHHGTAEVSVDDTAGQEVKRQRRDPYGGARGPAVGAVAGSRGFVGGTVDESTGLTRLGAREYDPGTGRFISVDPIVDYEEPQQLQPYAYANNSPVSFTDPDGRAYVTRRVVSYRTIYQTVIRKVRQTIRLIVTLMIRVMVLVLAMFFRPALIPRNIVIIKHIIRYIRELVKRVIKVINLVRTWVQTKKVKTGLALLRLADDLIKKAKAIHKEIRTWEMVSLAIAGIIAKSAWDRGHKSLQVGLGFLAQAVPFSDEINKGTSKVVGWGAEGLVRLTGGSCYTREGMRVCESKFRLYGGSGTTYGDTFVTSHGKNPSSDLIAHEKAHRDQQWRRFGGAFAVMYLDEQLRVFNDGDCNRYEMQAGSAKGGYGTC